MKPSRIAVLSASICFALSLASSAPRLLAEDAESAPAASLGWAFQPLRNLAPPRVRSELRVRTPVDAFVLARLEAAGLDLSPEADRATLIRRVTLDLTGLPPTPAEVASFVADSADDAYDRLVDRLLASPRYGERWGRHWLDLVRYAESDGYKSDRYRPDAWRYRDWVIDAFNRDMPYDRFLAAQLAADQIAPDDGELAVATGFLRHWPLEDNGRLLPEMWQTVLAEVTDVTGSAFLGLTLGCARCHDHKFDPISQRDYFGLQAFFATMAPRNDLLVGSPKILAEYEEQKREWEAATSDVRRRLEALEEPHRRGAEIAKSRKFPLEVQRIATLDPNERTVRERQIMMIGGHELHPSEKDMLARMPKDVKVQWEALRKELAQFDDLKPASLPRARGIRELDGQPPPVVVPDDSTGDPISPRFLPAVRAGGRPATGAVASTSLTADAPERAPPARQDTDASYPRGRRAALADWITGDASHLSARVMVNRLWQHHFARGIVETPSDFGKQGGAPTHPDLLDWLARQFIESGWSIKEMHRVMVRSSTYRQQPLRSATDGRLERDPENRLLSRRTPSRVEAEVLRDSILATSGELALGMRGASVFPVLPKGISERYAWKPTDDSAAQSRRSVYLAVKRNMKLPLLDSFDLPDNHFSCAQRAETTTPSQALLLLNGDWMLERAQRFAGRLLRESEVDPGALVDRAYSIAFGRKPNARERDAGTRFLREQSKIVAERLEREEPVARPVNGPADVETAFGVALVDYCHALWNVSEFVYVD